MMSIQPFKPHCQMTKNSPVKNILRQTSASREAGKAVKAGAIILAGGHGSRFGYDAPKGCYPISPVDKKSLYELFAMRSKGHTIAFMTSDATHDATCKHFEDNNYFGLDKENVSFFMQKNLPLKDLEGNSLSITAPDGNGALFWHFDKLEDWEKKGISHVTVMTVDNVLADPFQLDLIGYNALHDNDMTIACITRENPEEHVGVLVEQDGKLKVVEYTELDDSERFARLSDGSLKYPFANISYFAFSLSFIKKIRAHTPQDLPLHLARKKVTIDGREVSCLKSEYFIFDLVNFADKVEALLLPRKDYFSPLKTKSDIQTAQQALTEHGIF